MRYPLGKHRRYYSHAALRAFLAVCGYWSLESLVAVR
jgi:hypothetical protein